MRIIMKKIIISFVAVSICIVAPAFSAIASEDSFKNCSSAGASTTHCKSRAKRKRDEKAKCEAMTNATEKADCLKILADKAEKKEMESGK
jgi:hypothetical protein